MDELATADPQTGRKKKKQKNVVSYRQKFIYTFACSAAAFPLIRRIVKVTRTRESENSQAPTPTRREGGENEQEINKVVRVFAVRRSQHE